MVRYNENLCWYWESKLDIRRLKIRIAIEKSGAESKSFPVFYWAGLSKKSIHWLVWLIEVKKYDLGVIFHNKAKHLNLIDGGLLQPEQNLLLPVYLKLTLIANLFSPKGKKLWRISTESKWVELVCTIAVFWEYLHRPKVRERTEKRLWFA